MGEKGGAFVKGGCGCLIAFVVIGAFVALLGGNVRIDAGGACMLFVIGGGIGLIVLWIYNSGKHAGGDGGSGKNPGSGTGDSSFMFLDPTVHDSSSSETPGPDAGSGGSEGNSDRQ